MGVNHRHLPAAPGQAGGTCCTGQTGTNHHAAHVGAGQRPGDLSGRFRLPAGVDAVGLVVNATDAEFEAIRAVTTITLWQFHGDESPEACQRRAAGQPWMKAARVGNSFAFDDFSLQYRQANALLLDALVEGYGGGGIPFDWSGIPQAWISANAPRVVLSGGLNVHNVGEAIARLHPCAVDVSSGVDISKGAKDHALMKQFIEAVRAADASTSL